MNVAEIRNTAKPDVKKVFGAIAIIISRRGEGKVRLVGVRKVSEGVRKAG